MSSLNDIKKYFDIDGFDTTSIVQTDDKMKDDIRIIKLETGNIMAWQCSIQGHMNTIDARLKRIESQNDIMRRYIASVNMDINQISKDLISLKNIFCVDRTKEVEEMQKDIAKMK